MNTYHPKEVQDRLHQMRCEADSIIDRYLRENGWEYSSSNILCQWFWQKAMPDGRVAMMTRDNALRFQEAFDQKEIDEATEQEGED